MRGNYFSKPDLVNVSFRRAFLFDSIISKVLQQVSWFENGTWAAKYSKSEMDGYDVSVFTY